MLASPAAKLLRDAHRLGAKFDIDGDALVIVPETAIPESLRQKLFACEQEAVESLRGLIDTRDMLRAMITALEDADQFGARYAILPNGELAIYTVRAPLPPNLWHELHGFRREIASAMETLGVVGPVELADVIRLIEEYDGRAEKDQ